MKIKVSQLKEIILEELELVLLEKDKKLCGPGNPYHHGSDAKVPGGFASADDEGSWSHNYHSSASGCDKGKLKKGKGKATQWTKASRCGRDGEWLCSDPKKKKWDEALTGPAELSQDSELVDDDDGWVKIRKLALDRCINENILLALDQFEQAQLEEDDSQQDRQKQVMAYCQRAGLRSFRQWLEVTNSIRRAEKGDLLEPPKKAKQ